MFLKRLDLSGFKSFAPRTTTDLHPGIVVVVGPNGSGKSNIADSVRWVLGEQSAKAVRARKPEEVIFAGSASRQPLGMAEVSLVLDNSDGSLPIEFGEVRVTRRLFRSGDSEYLLNGAKVRLRDITQLLLHAGLSPDSYSVIGQGSIDELILQRPEERRIAFESAADIRRHQLRLNETRSRLASTENNLIRVHDVIAELAPHVRRLKTQADRAARGESFQRELHGLLLRYYRHRLSQARAQQDSADQELQQAAKAADLAEAETLGAEEALVQLDSAIAALDEQLAVLRPRVEGYREQAGATERGLAVIRERLAGLEDRRANAEADVERLARHLQRLVDEETTQSETDDTVQDDAEHGDALEGARQQLTQLLPALEAAQTERRAAASARDHADHQLREAEARLRRVEQQLHALESSLAVEEARRTDRAARLRALEEQLARDDELRAELTERQQRTTAALHEASTRAARAGGAERSAAEALQGASQALARAQGALEALRGGSAADATSDMPPEWQRLLTDLPVLGLAGALAERIQPVDRLLRAFALRIVVLDDDAAAREAHRRLSDANEASAWAVLSTDGLLLMPAGELPLGAADDVSSVRDWQRRLHELRAEVQQAERARDEAAGAAQQAGSERQDAEAAAHAARAAAATAAAELEQHVRGQQTRQTERDQLQAEGRRSATALEQRSAERNTAEQHSKQLHEDIAADQQQREAAIERLTTAEASLAQLAEAVNQAQADLAALEAAQAQRQVERLAREALQARIQAEMVTTRHNVETASRQTEQLAQQVAELVRRESQLIEEVQSTLRELAPMEQEFSSAEQRRGDIVAERRSLELRLVELRTAERLAREEREELHVQAQRAADELERLRGEIAETAELETDAAGGPAWAEQLRLDEPDAEPQPAVDLEAMRRRINVLQRELRAVGGVAESVVDEFREISERHDFLVQQSEDLRAAMAELQTAAGELEAHMRERFSAVFEATQTAFQECFSKLFGGGEARLVLTEPDDLLRTGIDIIARPPGKKLQGLLSLSGGERALTIVALLFGLLRVNPTPFCVLDEVDAALDEANVQRFANLLADFAQAIQFVVVTHNRATMDRADALYGVSMDADGISKIFSIRPHAVATLA